MMASEEEALTLLACLSFWSELGVEYLYFAVEAVELLPKNSSTLKEDYFGALVLRVGVEGEVVNISDAEVEVEEEIVKEPVDGTVVFEFSLPHLPFAERSLGFV